MSKKKHQTEESKKRGAKNNKEVDELLATFSNDSTQEEQNLTDDGIVAEKAQISIGENAHDKEVCEGQLEIGQENTENVGSTRVFDATKIEIPDIENEVLDLSELEESAKDYFNANHTSSIDDKINALRKNSEEGLFEVVPDDEEALQPSNQKQKSLKKSKRKRKDVVSNDDIELLAGVCENEQSFDEDSQEDEDEMLGALGVKKSDNDFETAYSKYIANDEPEVEYTDTLQESIIIKELRGKAIKSLLSILITIVITVLCGYFEGAVGTNKAHPAIFETGRYGIVYALSMLQLMFFGVIFNFDGVKRAFNSLKPSQARPEALAALTLCVCTLHTVLSITLVPNNPQLVSYCTVGCLSLVMLSVNSFIKAYTALTSFCIAASKKPKFSTTELDATSAEAGAFAKYLERDTTIFTVSKNSFMSGFFKKIFAVPKATLSSVKLGLAGIIVGIVCGIFSGLISSDVYHGVTTGACVMLAAFPVNLLLATALPHLVFSLKASLNKTAFIGEAACDAYTEAGILSFDDTEVFPAKSVKVSSIRTYSDSRIDKVIIYMARVFDKLGGPLSYVFANSVQGNEEIVGEAQIVEHCENGLRVKIDGMEILLGNSNFFRLFDITTPSDNIDESFLQSRGSIMYMSVDGEMAAKFYIKYTMNPGFEKILHSLYDAGICVGIKTLDPCINTSLVTGNLKSTNYPVSVIKKQYEENARELEEASFGSLVSLTGIHNFLKGFVSLDKLRNIYRTNNIVGTVCAILSVIITAALTLTGAVGTLSVSFFVLLQLLWCLPAIMFTFIGK